MAVIKKYWVTMVVSMLFWCIVNESFSLTTILVGFVVALLATVLVAYLFTDHEDPSHNYRLSLWAYIKYIFILFPMIFKSTWEVISIILYGDDKPMIVKVKTNVTRDWPICMIANGITLTPGTVTIDVQENELTVLWLNPTTRDPEEASEIVLGQFEKALINKEEKEKCLSM